MIVIILIYIYLNMRLVDLPITNYTRLFIREKKKA